MAYHRLSRGLICRSIVPAARSQLQSSLLGFVKLIIAAGAQLQLVFYLTIIIVSGCHEARADQQICRKHIISLLFFYFIVTVIFYILYSLSLYSSLHSVNSFITNVICYITTPSLNKPLYLVSI